MAYVGVGGRGGPAAAAAGFALTFHGPPSSPYIDFWRPSGLLNPRGAPSYSWGNWGATSRPCQGQETTSEVVQVGVEADCHISSADARYHDTSSSGASNAA